jgi:hypothetical protein
MGKKLEPYQVAGLNAGFSEEIVLGKKPQDTNAIARNEGEISSSSRAAKKMTDKQLVARVKSGFKKIKAELPYILELKNRFAALPRGSANICGCKTWKTFCIEHLHRTPRAVAYALAEENETVAVVIDRPAEDRTIAKPPRVVVTTENYKVPLPRVVVTNETYKPSLPEPREQSDSVTRLGVKVAPKPTAVNDAQPPMDAETEGYNRVAYNWLKSFLLHFESDAIALATPEEVFSKLTRDELAIWPNCINWLEEVFGKGEK